MLAYVDQPLLLEIPHTPIRTTNTAATGGQRESPHTFHPRECSSLASIQSAPRRAEPSTTMAELTDACAVAEAAKKGGGLFRCCKTPRPCPDVAHSSPSFRPPRGHCRASSNTHQSTCSMACRKQLWPVLSLPSSLARPRCGVCRRASVGRSRGLRTLRGSCSFFCWAVSLPETDTIDDPHASRRINPGLSRAFVDRTEPITNPDLFTGRVVYFSSSEACEWCTECQRRHRCLVSVVVLRDIIRVLTPPTRKQVGFHRST